MSAAIDLALALVEKDLGTEIARAVAKILVLYHRRAGGQSQFSTSRPDRPYLRKRTFGRSVAC